MEETLPWIAGGVISLIGIVGLFLSAEAADGGIYLFGLALFAFAVIYVFWQIKRAFDRRDTPGAAE